MTSPEKLKALLDLVYPNPFTKTTTTDVDGNIKVTYSATTPQPIPFDGMDPETPSGRKVIDAMVNSLVGPIEIFQNGKTYRKYSVVREGLSDYISVEETSSFPSSQSWVKIRENVKGPQGDAGINAQSTIEGTNGSSNGESSDQGGFDPTGGGGALVFDPISGTFVPA